MPIVAFRSLSAKRAARLLILLILLFSLVAFVSCRVGQAQEPIGHPGTRAAKTTPSSNVEGRGARDEDTADVQSTVTPATQPGVEGVDGQPARKKASTPDTTASSTEVDPVGAEVVIWHASQPERESAFLAMVQAFNEGNEWGITVREPSVRKHSRSAPVCLGRTFHSAYSEIRVLLAEALAATAQGEDPAQVVAELQEGLAP